MPFTPIHTFVGAVMMSVAATELMLLNGQVLGISGFAHRVLSSFAYTVRSLFILHSTENHPPQRHKLSSDPEQLALLSMVGLIFGGFVVGGGRSKLEDHLHVQLVDVHSGQTGWKQATGHLVAGFLVGLGSKLANGCTSGHMLCGVSRLSPRSLVATSIFVSTGVITHLFVDHSIPFVLELEHDREADVPSWWLILLMQAPVILYKYLSVFLKNSCGERFSRRLVAFSTSFHFALGLALSGMLRPSKILNFMSLTPSAIHSNIWDPSLLFVVVGGILLQLLVWRHWLGDYVRRPGTRPTFAPSWSISRSPSNWRDGITARLVFGATLFGIGWGLCGICPGPAAVLVGVAWGGEHQIWERVSPWVFGFIVGGIFGDWL